MSIFLKVAVVTFDPVSKTSEYRSRITSKLMDVLSRIRVNSRIQESEDASIKDLMYPTEIDLRDLGIVHKVNEFPTLYLQVDLEDLKNEGVICIIKELYNAVHIMPAMKNIIYFANNLASYIYKEIKDIDTNDATYVYLDVYRPHLYTQGHTYSHDVNPLKLPSGKVVNQGDILQLTNIKDIIYVCRNVAHSVQLAHCVHVSNINTQLELNIGDSLQTIELSKEYIFIGTEFTVLLYVKVTDLLNAYAHTHKDYKLCISYNSHKNDTGVHFIRAEDSTEEQDVVYLIELSNQVDMDYIVQKIIELSDKVSHKSKDNSKHIRYMPEGDIIKSMLCVMFTSLMPHVSTPSYTQDGLLFIRPIHRQFQDDLYTEMAHSFISNDLLKEVMEFIYYSFIKDSILDIKYVKGYVERDLDGAMLTDACIDTLLTLCGISIIRPQRRYHEIRSPEILSNLKWHMLNQHYLLVYYLLLFTSGIRDRFDPEANIGLMSSKDYPMLPIQYPSRKPVKLKIFPYYSTLSESPIDTNMEIVKKLFKDSWKEMRFI